jgi:hypothetical protein
LFDVRYHERERGWWLYKEDLKNIVVVDSKDKEPW